MVDVLKNIDTFKIKKFDFNNHASGIITYNYYFNKLTYIIKQIIKYKGDLIKLIQKYKTYHLKSTELAHINFSEITKNNNTFITRFSIDLYKTNFEIQYEFLLYHILYRKLGNNLLQFPKDEMLYYSKNVNHIGYILSPILSNINYNSTKKKFYSLRDILETNEKCDIETIINIILQVLCSLSTASDKLKFTHYNCNIDNIFVYHIQDNSYNKYIKFNLPIGEVFIKSKYIIFFTNLSQSHINIRYFKSKLVKNKIIEYWLDNDHASKFSPNYDIYTFINSIFSILTKKTDHKLLSSRITGHIDKKTIFSMICNKMRDDWKNNTLTYKNPTDLIQTFHEMGLSSLRLPSNRKIQLFGEGNTGEIVKTRMTYSNIKNTHKSDNDNNNPRIDIDDCTWNEIRTIAKEFGLKSRGKGINKAFLKKKIRDEIPFYHS